MKTKYLLVPFSYIFHPIFISVYGAVLFFIFQQVALENVYLAILQIAILTLFLPILFYFLLRTLKIVSSFTEANLEERKIPIFTQMILLYCLLKFGELNEFFPELYKFILAGFISSFIVLVSVILKFKASLHMIGITSLLVFTILFTNYLGIQAVNTIVYLIVCVGFVASSRLYMKSHSPLELVVGICIGAIPQVFVWIYNI